MSERPSSVVSDERQQLGQVEVRDLGHDRAQLVLAAAVRHPVDVQQVEQAAAGVADRGDDPFQAAPAVVLDDDAGVGREIGAQIGIDPLGIGDGGRNAVVDETPGQRTALDEKLDVEGAREDAMKRPDDQLVLTDGQRAHNRRF